MESSSQTFRTFPKVGRRTFPKTFRTFPPKTQKWGGAHVPKRSARSHIHSPQLHTYIHTVKDYRYSSERAPLRACSDPPLF